jgi:hypothetical protein
MKFKVHPMPIFLLAKLFLVACVIVFTGCASPDMLLRSHAYEGPPKSKEAVAAVFTAHPGIQTYHSLICEVNGKSYRRLGAMSSCPSIVYLTPGKHTLKLETYFANFRGLYSYEINVDAARVYEITTSARSERIVVYGTRAFPEGYVLTYKDIGPFMFEGKPRANGPVPIEAN